MKGLSTKLQERLALNTDWTFLELVSNAIIADDVNRAHQESKQARRLWQPPRAVLLTSIGWCVLHMTTHRSSSIISWLPVHRRIGTLCRERWPPTNRVAPTTIEDGHSAMHLLQLWSSWSHRSRLYCTNADFCSSSAEPLQPVTSGSNNGRRYKNWPCELHNYR
jgi:hypothetical protein